MRSYPIQTILDFIYELQAVYNFEISTEIVNDLMYNCYFSLDFRSEISFLLNDELTRNCDENTLCQCITSFCTKIRVIQSRKFINYKKSYIEKLKGLVEDFFPEKNHRKLTEKLKLPKDWLTLFSGNQSVENIYRHILSFKSLDMKNAKLIRTNYGAAIESKYLITHVIKKDIPIQLNNNVRNQLIYTIDYFDQVTTKNLRNITGYIETISYWHGDGFSHCYISHSGIVQGYEYYSLVMSEFLDTHSKQIPIQLERSVKEAIKKLNTVIFKFKQNSHYLFNGKAFPLFNIALEKIEKSLLNVVEECVDFKLSLEASSKLDNLLIRDLLSFTYRSYFLARQFNAYSTSIGIESRWQHIVAKSIDHLRSNSSSYLYCDAQGNHVFSENNLTASLSMFYKGSFTLERGNYYIHCEDALSKGRTDITIKKGDRILSIIESKLLNDKDSNNKIGEKIRTGIHQLYSRYSKNSSILFNNSTDLSLMLFMYDKNNLHQVKNMVIDSINDIKYNQSPLQYDVLDSQINEMFTIRFFPKNTDQAIFSTYINVWLVNLEYKFQDEQNRVKAGN